MAIQVKAALRGCLAVATTTALFAMAALPASVGVVLTGTLAALPSSAQAQTPPDRFVESLSNDVLGRIRSDKSVQSGDFQQVSKFVDSAVMRSKLMCGMTALSVGRAWRQASPEQQKALVTEFRTLLLRTYSGALSQVGDKQVRVRPFRGDAAADDVIVRTEIVGGRGDPIQLDYRLEKAGSAWKIYDVNVLGIWIVQTYRDQFAQEISTHGVDGLIRSLSEKNRQFDAAPRN
jgi:phospholipid transport system substrate-binding protein